MTPLTPDLVRGLTERLVRVASVSPDAAGERACAEALAAAMPDGVETGTWPCADGRPVVWAHLPGRSARTVLVLGHYDTVGVAEYESLGDPRGEAIAFDPAALRETILRRSGVEPGRLAADPARDPQALPDRVRADIAEEALAPGTWMFGRGALDMKSGLAAGVAALAALADDPERAGGVLFVVTPDEEHESAGMVAAVPAIAAMAGARGLELIGAINLDYVTEPVMWNGAVGKVEAGCYVLGLPTHAGAPMHGVDANQLAAEIVKRVTERRELVDRAGHRVGVPPVALRLRDLKPDYNVQTAAEAVAEFNLITFGRPLGETMNVLRNAVVHALESQAEVRREMSDWLGIHGRGLEPGSARARVLTWPELVARAGSDVQTQADGDARAATLGRLRALCRAAHLDGPAVIVYALPPYYPALAPGKGAVARAADALARSEGLQLRPWYPFVSDVSYLAWHGDDEAALAAHLPAIGGGYHLPVAAARALDLEAVTLGPWGRDAHGLYERVHAPWAFERLPGLVAALIRGSFDA